MMAVKSIPNFKIKNEAMHGKTNMIKGITAGTNFPLILTTPFVIFVINESKGSFW